MKMMDQTFNAGTQVGAELNTVQTTLYDLVAAINAAVLPEEDWIVTDAVLELFETGHAEFLWAN
ncbi:MAG: hypothetical protein PVI82_05475 [Desulfobacterales bacterium]|jgi:hypothetical protein